MACGQSGDALFNRLNPRLHWDIVLRSLNLCVVGERLQEVIRVPICRSQFPKLSLES